MQALPRTLPHGLGLPSLSACLTESAGFLMQASTISDLREELAGKRADVQHLKSLTNELKSSRDHLKGQLESTQSTLRDIQAALSACKQDRTHFEKEGERLAEEAGRLSIELHKSTTEVARLKEWQDVLKKVQDDKLREEQASS